MMPRTRSSSNSVGASESPASVSVRVKSALLHAAAGLALAAGASNAMACPGQPAPVDPSIFSPQQSSGDSGAVLDPSGPAVPQPCAPPVWVSGGSLPPVSGPSYEDSAPAPTYSVGGVPQSYSAPAPTYSTRQRTTAILDHARAHLFRGRRPAAIFAQMFHVPAPTYSYGGQTYSATPQAAPPNPYPGDYPSAPPQAVYAPAPQPAVPPAPYPPAFRTAIAPNLPQHLKVLSSSDVDRYARAYAASDARLYASADVMLAQVEDPVLQGSVLAKRYMAKSSSYNPRYAELYACARLVLRQCRS